MKVKKVGTRQQLILLALLAGVLILALVKWGGGSGAPVPKPSAKAGRPDLVEEKPAALRPRALSGEKPVSPEDVPMIRIQDLEPVRGRRASEQGRNIFDFRQPTVPPPPAPTPAPPPPPAPGSANFIGPMPPPPPTPTPVPPEIPFKFIGTFGPKDRPIAALVLGGQIVNAHAGDVVFERFIIRRVGYESIDVGFVGPWTETRRLGIAP